MILNQRFTVACTALLLGVIGCQSLPTPSDVTYPEPGGPYKIGQTSYHLVDTTRAEPYTEEPGDLRELMVYVYYPAEPSSTQTRTWLDSALTKAVSEALGIDPTVLERVHAHTYQSAPASPAKPAYPVLIMSHGDEMLPAVYTTIIEELSSHGYVVVSISHPYNAPVTAYPDGRQAVAVEEAGASYMPLPADAPFWESSQALWRQGQETLEVWTADVLFVLDSLADINAQPGLLQGKLDLTRLGMFGHSFGGATATELLHRDARVLAAANLDGNVFNIYPQGLARPLMNIITGDTPEPEATEALLEELGLTEEQFETVMAQSYARRRAYLASDEAYNVSIEGTAHTNFTDFGLLEPALPGIAQGNGPIDPRRALRITNDYLLAFFGRYLNSEASPLLTEPSPYGEVLFERR